MKIGVLALQGDFDAHRRRLEELGAEVVLVKKHEQLDGIDGLVIPGGESGTFLKLLGEGGFAKLKDFVREKPTFGTCAGIPTFQIEACDTGRSFIWQEFNLQVTVGWFEIKVGRNQNGVGNLRGQLRGEAIDIRNALLEFDQNRELCLAKEQLLALRNASKEWQYAACRKP